MFTATARSPNPNTCRIRDRHAPLAAWKRVDDVQASLSKRDQDSVAREGGLITRAEYEKYMAHVTDGDKG